MGVVNVTPDSFSDGGDNVDPAVAVATRDEMLAEGAALVDVGGESTRPGADDVSLDEELRRVLPVLEGLAGLPVSIDTSKAEVARRALELGAVLVNDVTALRADPTLAGVVADAGAYVCLMHMQGEPRTMQVEPRYDDVVGEVAGVPRGAARGRGGSGDPGGARLPRSRDRLRQDPRPEPALIRGLERICSIGRPVLVGLSRKSTLARVLGDPDGAGRHDAASVGAAVAAFDRGATLFRVHDVAPTSRRWRPPRRSSGGARVTIELYGIVLHGFHGVLDEERRDGQRFLVDVELDLEHEQAARSDRIEDAVDYRAVVARVRADLGRARLPPARGLRGGDRRRAPRRTCRCPPCACACGSPTSCSTLLSSTRPCPSSARLASVRGRRPHGDPEAVVSPPERPSGRRPRGTRTALRPLFVNVSRSDVPGAVARASRSVPTIRSRDADGALLPEAQVERSRSAVNVAVMRPFFGSQTR